MLLKIPLYKPFNYSNIHLYNAAIFINVFMCKWCMYLNSTYFSFHIIPYTAELRLGANQMYMQMCDKELADKRREHTEQRDDLIRLLLLLQCPFCRLDGERTLLYYLTVNNL